MKREWVIFENTENQTHVQTQTHISLAFLLTDIVLSKQLHSHNGKYEDNNAQYKGQIT